MTAVQSLLLLKIVEGSGVEGRRAIAGLQDLACHQLQLLGDRKTRGCRPAGPARTLAPPPMAGSRLLALLRPEVAVSPGEGLLGAA